MSGKSRLPITPREEFRVLWTENFTCLSANRSVRSRFRAWALRPHSTKKEPSSLSVSWCSSGFLRLLGNPFFFGQQRETTSVEEGLYLPTRWSKIVTSSCCSCKSRFPNPCQCLTRPLLMDFWFRAMLCFICFVTFCPHPPRAQQVDVHIKRNSCQCTPGLKS